jgi:glycosyltransferase involved in cell wall biosynthesis
MSAAKRLIFVNRYFFPDVSATSQLLTDLAVAVGNEGFDVHMICSRLRYDDPAAALPKSDRVGAVQIHRIWSTRFGRAGLLGRLVDYKSFYVCSVLAALRLTRANDLLIALTDPPMLSVGLAWVARQRGAKVINWLQDLFPEVAIALKVAPLPTWLTHLLLRIRNDSLHAATMNVVLGQRMRERVLALGVAPERITVIENWADGEAIRPMATSASVLRASLPPGTSFVVQYSGNLGRAHEYQTILGAAQALSDEVGLLFLMIGGGANMVRLQDEAARLGLRNLLFLPYCARESLRDALAAGDIHLSCLLPEMEGMIVPSKFYGILAAGRMLIVIGDPQGEQARTLREHWCGEAVACGDSAGLARLLRALRSDPRRCEQAGARARTLFDSRYAFPIALQKWRALLRPGAW